MSRPFKRLTAIADWLIIWLKSGVSKARPHRIDAQLNVAALFQVRDCFWHHAMAEMSLSHS